jgi:tetratricopeptide (TPR) repeat protein
MLAFSVSNSSDGRERGFTAGSFRSSGGVEGLLYFYLRRQLDALAVGHEGSARESAAVAVLRVLSDVESVAGLGVLNEDQITAKLTAAQPEQASRRAIQWLSSQNVRLIVPRAGGFRLVHDKVVEAVGKLVSESVAAADRANSLLNQRVAEYLVNGRSARFLLPGGEWRFLLSHKAFLNWGDREAEKRELLEASRARTYRRWALALGAVIALGVGWRVWDDSPWVLRWRIRSEIVALEKESHYPHLTDVVRNLMRAGFRTEAIKILQSAEEASKTESYDDDLTETLGIAVAFAEVGKQDKASDLFKRAANSASGIEDPVRRMQLTGAIASALAKAGKPDESLSTFKTALGVAAGIGSDIERSKALSAVALAMAEAGAGQRRADFGALAEHTASEVPVPRERVFILLNLAVATAKAGGRTEALALTENAITIVESIPVPEKVNPMVDVASVLAEIGEPEKAILHFRRAEALAVDLSDKDLRSQAFTVISMSMAQSSAKTSGSLMLRQSRLLAERIDVREDRAKAFREIAVAFAENGDHASALDLFEIANHPAPSSAEVAPSAPSPSRVTLHSVGMAVRMANALGQGGDRDHATELLLKTRHDAIGISDAGARVESLRIIANSLTRNGNGEESAETLTLAATAARQIGDRRSRSVALRNLVTAMAQTGAMPVPPHRRSDRLRLFQQAQEAASAIVSYEDQSNALRQLAVSMAVVGDLGAARRICWQDHVPDSVPVNLSSILLGSGGADDNLPAAQTEVARDLH